MGSLVNNVSRGWKRIFTFTAPPLLAILPVMIPTKEAQCGYVLILMALFWMTEAIPLAVTAFMPLVFFPLFGIQTGAEVGASYFGDTAAMFLGSLIAATAVEHCNLHNRVALRALLVVGVTPKGLLAGVMAVTGILSMFISNAATAVLMVPMVEGIIQQLRLDPLESDGIDDSTMTDHMDQHYAIKRKSVVSIHLDELSDANEDVKQGSYVSRQSLGNNNKIVNDDKKVLRCALFLGICYAANIGGTGSLTGSPPNLVLKDFIDTHHANYKGLTFTTWLLFAFPIAVVNITFGWVFISFRLLRNIVTDSTKSNNIERSIRKKYTHLGSMSFHEIAVATLFSLLLGLWFFRSPGFMPGWGEIFEKEVKDSCAAYAIVLLMFIVPRDIKNWATSPALLDWKVIHENTPWSVVFLVGGSIALSKGAQTSNLSSWVGGQLTWLEVFPPMLIVLIVCTTAMVLTEVTSNTATCSVLLPIVNEVAKQVQIHPILVQLPLALGCSYAFMLPVATAPNAIIAGSSGMTTREMAAPGVVMKLICLVVLMLFSFTLAGPIFNLDDLTPFDYFTRETTTTPFDNTTESLL